MKKVKCTGGQMYWVKCSDMLPEMDGRYLTACVDFDHPVNTSDCELHYFENGAWWLTEDDDEPTHWAMIQLPLPTDN